MTVGIRQITGDIGKIHLSLLLVLLTYFNLLILGMQNYIYVPLLILTVLGSFYKQMCLILTSNQTKLEDSLVSWKTNLMNGNLETGMMIKVCSLGQCSKMQLDLNLTSHSMISG